MVASIARRKFFPSYISIILLSLILLLLPHAAAQDDATDVDVGDSAHSVCRPDDARCLALQSDVCNPWNTTAVDKCAIFHSCIKI